MCLLIFRNLEWHLKIFEFIILDVGDINVCVCLSEIMNDLDGKELRDCQRFAEHRAGALFMRMGEKKIQTTLKFIKFLQDKFDYVLWIAPSMLLANKLYRSSICLAARGLNKKICFYSIEGVSSSNYRYLSLYSVADNYKTFCVIDESIAIKNMEAGRTRRLLSMYSMFKYRLILSATPLTQGLIDLYSQIQFINPSILRMTETQFSNCFLPFFIDRFSFYKRWSTPLNEKKLMKLIRPYVFECDLHLGRRINYFDYDCELTPAEEDDYFNEKCQFLASRPQFCFLEVVQKFQTVYIYAKNKILMLTALLDRLIEKGEKAVIYVRFLDEIKFFREVGVFEKYNYVVMTAKVRKRKVIDEFFRKADFMICTYGVSFEGMSLQFCNHVVFYTQTFDYKNKLQSLNNVYSGDEGREMNVHNFWLNTGMDMLIRESQAKKKGVLSNVCKIMGKNRVLEL